MGRRQKPRIRHEIEVYVSDLGYVCVQASDVMGDEDTVLLAPDQVPFVIQCLQEYLPEAEELFRAFDIDEVANDQVEDDDPRSEVRP
jgi:hypothetical protein